MPANLPSYITIVFFLAVALTFILFLNATKNKKVSTILILLWLAITGILAYKDFFQKPGTMPPRLMLAIVPAVIFSIVLLVVPKAKSFRDNLDLKKLTLLHIVRIPVELVLYWLAANKWIPELMTFAGRNFDIISGITALVILFVCFNGSQVKNKTLLLVWNFVCLGLLLNIVINAVLSAPFPFQQFAFDQPNKAILYFPFVWLPCFIVVIVLFSHLIAIKKLLRK